MRTFYEVLGRITWQQGKWLALRRLAAVPTSRKVGAAALVVAVVGLGLYAATRDSEEV